MEDRGLTSKWYVVSLGFLIAFFFTLILMCLPVLFKEISEDLGLSLVQIGTVWGMYPLGAIFATFMGGLLGDRFGAKRVTGLGCVLGGLAAALIGLSVSFITLSITVLLAGFVMAIIPGNTHKLCALWFRKGLGLANSVIGLGGGVGSVLSAVLTASILSPLLGGWNYVLFLYGALLIVVGIPVLLLHDPSRIETAASTDSEGRIPPRQAISHVIRNRNIWLLGFTFMGLWGAAMGVMGYLPLYLRGIGWLPITADSVLAVAGVAAMVGALPLGFTTDRIGLRKPFLLAAVLSTTIGIGLLLVGGVTVWASAILMGLFRTAMQSIVMTTVAETEGIGVKYAGTGIGIAFTLSYIGSIFSPIIGNSLAAINPSFAFIFWTGLAIVPLLLCFPFLKETGWRARGKARLTP